jgi:hypothetical protein
MTVAPIARPAVNAINNSRAIGILVAGVLKIARNHRMNI